MRYDEINGETSEANGHSKWVEVNLYQFGAGRMKDVSVGQVYGPVPPPYNIGEFKLVPQTFTSSFYYQDNLNSPYFQYFAPNCNYEFFRLP